MGRKGSSHKTHKGVGTEAKTSNFGIVPYKNAEEIPSPVRNGKIGNSSVLDSIENYNSDDMILLKDEKPEKKRKNMLVRTIWTFIMIGGFCICLAMGHIWVIALVALIQTTVFKEINAIANTSSSLQSIPFSGVLNWYFFIVSMYYIYGESLIYYLKHVIYVDENLLIYGMHHRFISAILYIIGFLSFVGSLKKGHYRGQFIQFCWTHMTLLLTVFQSSLVINNIFEGLFWFFLPCALVITNDIFAYVCGYIWGRTQLIQISPKKTVEGFVGGWICTIIIGVLIGNFIMQFKYMICPARDLGVTAFSHVNCVPNPTFTSRQLSLPEEIRFMIPSFMPSSITMAPMQFHILVLATFASLIAPFGGFFASGLKRALKLKDFGDSIPGHGGLTDRMDCQFMMGFFSHLYFQTFVSARHVTIGTILHLAMTNLSKAEQIELLNVLTSYLAERDSVIDIVKTNISI